MVLTGSHGPKSELSFLFFPSASLRTHSTSRPVQHLTAAVWRQHQPSGGRWYVRGSNRKLFHRTTGTEISSSNCQLSLDTHWPVATLIFCSLVALAGVKTSTDDHHSDFFIFLLPPDDTDDESAWTWDRVEHSRHALKHWLLADTGFSAGVDYSVAFRGALFSAHFH